MACGWSFNSTVQIIKYSNVDNFDKIKKYARKTAVWQKTGHFQI